MKKLTLFLILGTALTFYACEPDTPKPVNPNTKSPSNQNDTIPKITHLMAKSWRLTDFMQGASGSTNQASIYQSGFPNCQKDDLYKFKDADLLVVETGTAKCNSGETEKQGSWELNNNSSALKITLPSQTFLGMTGDFSVTELSSTKMILKQTVNSDEYTLIYTAQ